MENPSYTTFQLDLSVAGEHRLWNFTGLLRMTEAVDATDALDLSAKVIIRAGGSEASPIPFRTGNAIKAEFISDLRIQWTAQPGKIARFLQTRDSGTFDVDSDPPAQLLLTDAAGAMTVAAVGVTNLGTLIALASSTRRSLTLKNVSAATVYIGPLGVSTADGMPLDPGQGITLTNTAGAVYGITAAAGPFEVRKLAEG